MWPIKYGFPSKNDESFGFAIGELMSILIRSRDNMQNWLDAQLLSLSMISLSV